MRTSFKKDPAYGKGSTTHARFIFQRELSHPYLCQESELLYAPALQQAGSQLDLRRKKVFFTSSIVGSTLMGERKP